MRKQSKEQYRNITSVKEMGHILNITPRRVRQLCSRGIIFKESRNRYFLKESIAGFIEYQKSLAREQGRKSAFIFDLSTLDLPGAEEQAAPGDIILDLSGWER